MRRNFVYLTLLALLIGQISAEQHQQKGGKSRRLSGTGHNRHRNVHEVANNNQGTQNGGQQAAVEQNAASQNSDNSAAASVSSKEKPANFAVASSWHSQDNNDKKTEIAAKSTSAQTTSEVKEFADDHVTAWSSIPKDPFTWDGENSWEWDNPRTLYFEPTAGLGNRLRALASAVVLAKEYGVGLKVIWREEEACEACINGGFNSTYSDLFAEPKLRLVDNFPGSNYTIKQEMDFLSAQNREGKPAIPDHQCAIHYPFNHKDMTTIMENGWKMINGEDVLCVRGDVWLTEAGEKEGKFFFRLLKPSPMVQSMIDKFKYETEWEENHMVGVHVRRGDLTIWGKNSQHTAVKSLIPIENYIQSMKAQKNLAAGVRRVRFFLATDDAEAEKEIKAAFKPGYVMSYPKVKVSRLSVEGIQEALADVMLLADCPVLIGTYYSSYSETAKMMGWPFYIQIGHDLKKLSVETKFEKDDPEEEDEDQVMKKLLRKSLL